MTDSEVKRREQWHRISPELRVVMADLAFRAGDTITPEMKDHIQDQSIRDIQDEVQGDKDE